jgi:hypothetical protein
MEILTTSDTPLAAAIISHGHPLAGKRSTPTRTYWIFNRNEAVDGLRSQYDEGGLLVNAREYVAAQHYLRAQLKLQEA